MNYSWPIGPGVRAYAVELFADPGLSFQAKGLFGLISTFEDKQGLTAEVLASHSRDGRSAVLAALHELEKAGYLRRQRRRNSSGTLGPNIYLLADEEPAPETDTSGLTYAITDRTQPFVKIGCSRNLRNRLAGLQTSWPGLLEVIWQAPGGAALEAQLHRHFVNRRVRGEWFDFTDVDAVALISSAAQALGGTE